MHKITCKAGIIISATPEDIAIIIFDLFSINILNHINRKLFCRKSDILIIYLDDTTICFKVLLPDDFLIRKI